MKIGQNKRGEARRTSSALTRSVGCPEKGSQEANRPINYVKSKQRVADHGEVFTPAWMVEAMLDLVKGETERIDSRFLEPACGSGNFLVQILRRKLAASLLDGLVAYRRVPAEDGDSGLVIASDRI